MRVSARLTEPASWRMFLNGDLIAQGEGFSAAGIIGSNAQPGLNEVAFQVGASAKRKSLVAIQANGVEYSYNKVVLYSDTTDSIVVTSTADTGTLLLTVYDRDWLAVYRDTSESSLVWNGRALRTMQAIDGMYNCVASVLIDGAVQSTGLRKVLVTAAEGLPLPRIREVAERVRRLNDSTFVLRYVQGADTLSDTLGPGEYTADGTVVYSTTHFGISIADTLKLDLDYSPQEMAIIAPGDGTVFSSAQVTFSAKVTADNLKTIRFLVDGADLSGAFTEKDSLYTATRDLKDGHHTFKAVAVYADGWADTARSAFKVTTVPPDTEVVIRGVAYDGGDNEPLAGATVKVVETGVSATTDDGGGFALATGGFGEYKIKVTHPDYTTAMRFVTSGRDLDKSIPAIIVMPLNRDSVVLQAGSDSVFQLEDTKVAFKVPQGALASDKTVSATVYSAIEQLPNEQPTNDVFLFSVDLQPHGSTFDEPLEIRVPNKRGLSAGAKLPITYFNEETGTWDDVGEGTVSEDGESIVFTASHFSCFHGNYHHCVCFGEEGVAHTAQMKPSGCYASDMHDGLSSVSYRTGDLQLEYAVPGGAAMTDIGARFEYWSSTASPRMTITTRFDKHKFSPTYWNWKLYLPGKEIQWLFHGTPASTGASYIWDCRNEQGELLETGVYTYGIRVADVLMPGRYRYDYLMAENLYVYYDKPTTLKKYYYEHASVVNRRNSPYGAGWGLRGATRIVARKARLTEEFPQTPAYRLIDGIHRTAAFLGDAEQSQQEVSTAIGYTNSGIADSLVAVVGAGPYASIYSLIAGTNRYRSPYGSFGCRLHFTQLSQVLCSIPKPLPIVAI